LNSLPSPPQAGAGAAAGARQGDRRGGADPAGDQGEDEGDPGKAAEVEADADLRGSGDVREAEGDGPDGDVARLLREAVERLVGEASAQI